MQVNTNFQEAFKDLSFNEEKHLYSIGEKSLKGSVSSKLKDFYEPFPEEEAVQKTMSRTGKSKETILAEWKEKNEESKTRGHRVHLYAEELRYNINLEPSCPQEVAAQNFWKDKPEWIIPVAMELRMYHFKYMFPGTLDALFFNTKTGEYIIADYKTNIDIFKNYMEKKMLAPFENLLDSPYSHYTLQLSYYKILLEQLHIKVSRLMLIWLTLEGNYKIYDLEDCSEKLSKLLE